MSDESAVTIRRRARKYHAHACIVAIDTHCGGDPAKVGQMAQALNAIMDEYESGQIDAYKPDVLAAFERGRSARAALLPKTSGPSPPP